jgi:hypothetical protein
MFEMKNRQLALSSATKIRMLSYLFSGFSRFHTAMGGERILDAAIFEKRVVGRVLRQLAAL